MKVEIVKAIVEGEGDAAGGRVPALSRSKPSPRGRTFEFQFRSSSRRPPKKGRRDIETPFPLMFIPQRDAVVAQNE